MAGHPMLANQERPRIMPQVSTGFDINRIQQHEYRCCFAQRNKALHCVLTFEQSSAIFEGPLVLNSISNAVEQSGLVREIELCPRSQQG